MENNCYTPKEMEIDLIELMWRMLTQWKAILIVAVLFAVLVPSAMYMKEFQDYQAAQVTAKENAAKVANLDQATEDILEKLLPNERVAVEQALVNDKILKSKQEYLLNSLLVNLNTEEASSLSKGYVFSNIDDWSMQNALISGYSTAFRGDAALTDIMKAMGVDSQPRYIKELITIEGFADTDMSGFVKITITCPDKTAGDKVSAEIDKIMRRANHSLSKTVTNHQVKKIYTESASASSDVAAAAKQTAYSDLYNTQAQQRGHIATFSDEQTKAYEGINVLQSAAKEDVAEDANEKLLSPNLNMKSGIVGFLLGVILYIVLYVAWMVFSRRVDNAGTAQTYTRTRLLGSYYYLAKRSRPFAFLLRSKSIIKLHYGKEMDLTVQASRIACEINASCENKHVREIALLQLFEGDGGDNLLNAVANQLETPVLKIMGYPVISSNDLANVEHAILFLSDKSKLMTVNKVLCLCSDFGIQKNGSVFIGEI